MEEAGEGKKMVTIKDVAREANVSTMTVSRAFKEDSVIKKETREKILAVAKRLNYVPNYNAKSLVTNRKYSIGLFFSSLTEGTSQVYLGELINKIYRLLPRNYLLSVNSIDRSATIAETLIGRFDGILVAAQSAEDATFIQQMQEFGLPMVVMNQEVTDPSIYNISIDDKQGIIELVLHLRSVGVQTVGTILGIKGFSSTEQRLASFRETSEAQGLTIQPQAIQRGDYSIAGGYEAMRGIIHENIQLPDAIFCGNDDMAIGAIKACHDHALKVPEDISIIGFDDTSYVGYLSPALTTIHKPYEVMATQAMELLLALIEEQAPPQKKWILPTHLVIRDSVKPLAT